MEALSARVTVGLRAFALNAALDVGRETVALVGPSGAGKTTLLRAIAGLVRPTAGHVRLGADTWFDAATGIDRPPEQRAAGYVFQDYALFPHLTVRGNVGFGLGEPRRGLRGRRHAGPTTATPSTHAVDALLERFGIGHLAAARPASLSGGERQRVALVRALARQPRVLLLDEPLAALDPRTASVVRAELGDTLRSLGLPSLLVTHDFADAATLADRIGVLEQGTLRQCGTAAELLAAPADAFVATLTGALVLPGTATPRAGGGTTVTLDRGDTVVVPADAAPGPVGLVLHPWQFSLGAGEPGHAPAAAQGATNQALRGTVRQITPERGGARVDLGEGLVVDLPPGAQAPVAGAACVASFSARDARLVAADAA